MGVERFQALRSRRSRDKLDVILEMVTLTLTLDTCIAQYFDVFVLVLEINMNARMKI